MTTESKDLVLLATQYMQAWNAGNEDVLDRLADENLEVTYTHFGKVYKGTASYKEVLRMTYGYFPDIRINVKDVLNANNKATVFWEYTGTHKNGNLFGAEPSGKKVTVQGISVLEVVDGLIVRENGIVDNLSLIMQLGILK